jgi:FLVCR family MFS transporter 7
MAFMVIYLVAGPVSTYCLDTKGFRYTLLIAAWLNALGAWVRYAGEFAAHSSTNLGFQFLGTVLASLAQPAILGCPTLLAANWFGDNERATANTIGSIANPLGIAIGSVLSPILADDAKQMKLLMLVFAIPATIGAVLTQLTLHDKPPSPPSASAAEINDTFFNGLKKVIKNKPYLILLVAFGCGVGVFNAMTTLMGQIVAPNGYDDDAAGMFAAALVGVGLVGAGAAGAILDKTKAFLPMIRIAFVCATVTFILFALVNKPDNGTLIGVASGGMGLFCFAVLPVALELGVETTFPVNEGTSSGFLWISGQLFGTIFILLMEYPLLGDKVLQPNTTTTNTTKSFPDMQNSCWFVVGVGAFASVILMFMKTEYRRLKYDAPEADR